MIWRWTDDAGDLGAQMVEREFFWDGVGAKERLVVNGAIGDGVRIKGDDAFDEGVHVGLGGGVIELKKGVGIEPFETLAAAPVDGHRAAEPGVVEFFGEVFGGGAVFEADHEFELGEEAEIGVPNGREKAVAVVEGEAATTHWFVGAQLFKEPRAGRGGVGIADNEDAKEAFIHGIGARLPIERPIVAHVGGDDEQRETHDLVGDRSGLHDQVEVVVDRRKSVRFT